MQTNIRKMLTENSVRGLWRNHATNEEPQGNTNSAAAQWFKLQFARLRFSDGI
jgi:hypothetical protein